jgi:pimeloyl-ACP methyl ester carboxylesterase
MRTLPAASLLLSLVVLSGCVPSSATGQSPASVTLEPCTAFGGANALCGSLPVPEDPGNPSGRMIDLAITVLPATGPESDRRADPVFGLHGGPGAAARYLAPVFSGLPLRATRDVVLVDQRGTGSSNGMACGTEDAAEWMVLGLRFDFDPAGCPEFEADPTLYTTPIAMDDLDRVREAMGYDRINLWGGSYGARAALVYMRRHPDRVRSVVLDGVAPLSLKVPAEFPRTSQAALDLLLDDCRRDSDCARRGDVAAMLDETLARLAESPTEVTVPFPGEAAPVTIPYGRLEFASSILYALYNPFTSAAIPAAIQAAHGGDYGPAAALGATFAAAIRPTFSMGMTLSVLCAEDIPYFTEAAMDAEARGTFLGEEFGDGLHEACAAWPSGSVPFGYHDPVVSDIPTLLLSGEGDPVTPPEFADEAATSLGTSLHLVFPEMGHGQTTSPCGAAIVSAFYAAGSVDGLDASCVTNVRRPSFTR